MDIGIITFHCSYNFGSVLQCYALKKTLGHMGHNVRTIDYRGKDYRQYKLLRLARPGQMIENIVSLRRNFRRRETFESFISRELNLTSRRYTPSSENMLSELAKDFDCFICGSDQIWNLDCTGGPVGPYFLDFAGSRRRVAYAPSLAHASFDPKNFTDLDRRRIGYELDKFHAISVREASTVDIFQNLTKTEIEVCLDPTLLLNKEEYTEVSSPAPVEGPFVFAYMLEENALVMRQAERVAKIMGAKIVHISNTKRSFSTPSINLYGIGPAEFIDLIGRADAVVTNSFHATVFSLLLGAPFQTVATRNSGARMRELLAKLGEEEHLITDECDIIPEPAKPMTALPKLEQLKRRSLLFLRHALED